MIKTLSIILFILLAIIGGKRGIKTYITLYFNLGLTFLLMLLISWGFNPVICTLIVSVIITLLILFFLNEYNLKTLSSLISVSIVLLVMVFLIGYFNTSAHIYGYCEETIESVAYVEYDTGLDMITVSKSIIIIGLLGTVIDTSIAISSALYEVIRNNPKMNIKESFISGMNIGKDILGTTTNTLFFAYLGSFMTLLIYFIDFKYSFYSIINSKLFSAEYVRICLSGCASYLVIPITAIITSIMCHKGEFYEKIENYIRR